MELCGQEDLLFFSRHLILVEKLLRGRFRPTFSQKGAIVQKRLKTPELERPSNLNKR